MTTRRGQPGGIEPTSFVIESSSFEASRFSSGSPARVYRKRVVLAGAGKPSAGLAISVAAVPRRCASAVLRSIRWRFITDHHASGTGVRARSVRLRRGTVGGQSAENDENDGRGEVHRR